MPTFSPVPRRIAVVIATGLLLTSLVPAAQAAVGATGIDVVLPTGLQVSGHLADADGNPIADAFAALCVDDPTNCFIGGEPSGPDGAYTVAGVTPGTYYVEASATSDRNLLSSWYGGPGVSVTDPGAAVTIDISADTTGIDISLAAGLTMSGHVANAANEPVAGVQVGACGSVCSSAMTNAQGDYTVGGLVAGAYAVSVDPPTGSPYPRGYLSNGSVAPEPGNPVDVSSNTTGVDVVLASGRSVSGSVTGLTRPARIDGNGTRSSVEVPIAGNGSFTIPGFWPDEQVTLIVAEGDGSGFDDQYPIGVYDGTPTLTIDQSAAAAIDLSGGDVSGIDVAAPDSPSLQGHITGDDGGIPHGRLLLCSDAGCASSSIGGDGSYAFWNLPSTSHTLLVIAFDYVGGYVTATGVSSSEADAQPIVIAGNDVTRDLVLASGATISGRLTGPGGEPIVGGFAALVRPDGGFVTSAQTDANGDYTARGLAPGDYRIYVSGPEHSNYLPGYWSPTGYTADYEQSGLVHIESTAPTIVSTSPSNGATGVVRDGRLSVSFSAAVSHVTTSTVWLHAQGSTIQVGGKLSYDSVTHTAVFRPDKLKALTTYVFEVNGVTGTDGTPVAPTSISFTTGKK